MIPWPWVGGLLLWAVAVVLLAACCGMNDHPPARGLIRGRNSPNPPPRL